MRVLNFLVILILSHKAFADFDLNKSWPLFLAPWTQDSIPLGEVHGYRGVYKKPRNTFLNEAVVKLRELGQLVFSPTKERFDFSLHSRLSETVDCRLVDGPEASIYCMFQDTVILNRAALRSVVFLNGYQDVNPGQVVSHDWGYLPFLQVNTRGHKLLPQQALKFFDPLRTLSESMGGLSSEELWLAELLSQINSRYPEVPVYLDNFSSKYNSSEEVFSKLSSPLPILNLDDLPANDQSNRYILDTTNPMLPNLNSYEEFRQSVKAMSDRIAAQYIRGEKKVSRYSASDVRDVMLCKTVDGWIGNVVVCMWGSTTEMNLSFMPVAVFKEGMKGFPTGSLVERSEVELYKMNIVIGGHNLDKKRIADYFSRVPESDLFPQEIAFKTIFEQMQVHFGENVSFDVLGDAYTNENGRVIGHEMGHASSNQNEKLREAILTYWRTKLSPAEKKQVMEELELIGYNREDEWVMADEFTQYLLMLRGPGEHLADFEHHISPLRDYLQQQVPDLTFFQSEQLL